MIFLEDFREVLRRLKRDFVRILKKFWVDFKDILYKLRYNIREMWKQP